MALPDAGLPPGLYGFSGFHLCIGSRELNLRTHELRTLADDGRRVVDGPGAVGLVVLQCSVLQSGTKEQKYEARKGPSEGADAVEDVKVLLAIVHEGLRAAPM